MFLVQKVSGQIGSGLQNRLQGFSQSFGKQEFLFGKVRFSWLAFCLAKSGF